MQEKGVSLIESLLIVVLVGIMVFLIANIPSSLILVTKSKNLSLAREIAAKALEDKRATSYANLVNDTAAISDTRLSSLPHGSGTIVVEDCDQSICTNSESLKQITVTVNWTDNNKPQAVSLKTFIGEGGLNQ